jgi:hypothetical protein
MPPPQARHARACRGHPRLHCRATSKAWMAGTQPGHDELKVTAHGWHYAASGAESEGRLTTGIPEPTLF